jgi:beta-lactam-binding protein with PASTA domain
MPDLTGMPIVTAQAALQRVGLKGPTPTFVDVHIPDIGGANAITPAKPPVAPGSVVTQQPPAGARVDQNTPVKLTVAK